MIDFKSGHEQKALKPILETYCGIVNAVIPSHLSKAWSPILVTLSGIMAFLHPAINLFVEVSIIALQLLRLSYFRLFASTVIDMRLGQWRKMKFPMLVTLCGMSIVLRLMQSQKASLPMVVMLFGRLIDSRLVQP